MYKLEDRVLFDAALPVDIADAVDNTELQDVDSEDISSEEISDFLDGFEQNTDSNSEERGTNEIAELVDNLADTPEESLSNELYIVDTSVPDYETLIVNIPLDADVKLLDVKSDGIETISDILESYKGLDALHILSHGKDGELRVGDDVVSSENLSVYADEISQWNASLSDGADILLYGCNLAESSEGQQLVASVSLLTDADVAASTNVTGANGDWNLEFTTGSIEAVTVYADEYDYNLTTAPSAGGKITVTIGTDLANDSAAAGGLIDTSDGVIDAERQAAWDELNKNGGVSLREAVWFVSILDGHETITFGKDSSGADITTVTLTNDLTINTDVTIDGNGADVTTIALGDNALYVTQGIGDGNTADDSITDRKDVVDLTLSHVKLTGSGTANTNRAMVIATGTDLLQSNITIESVEFSDHTNTNQVVDTTDPADLKYTGSAIYGKNLNLSISNSYFSSLFGGRGTGAYVDSSTFTGTGLIFDSVSVANKSSSVIQAINGVGSSTLSYSTFIDTSIGTKAGTPALVLGAAVSSSVESNTTSASATVDKTGTVPAVTPALSATKRDGVRFYTDGNAGVGADNLPDRTKPSVVIGSSATGTTAEGDVTYTFTFNEPVTAFDASKITISAGAKGTFTAVSTTVYTLVVALPTHSTGVLEVQVEADKAADAAGNGNTASLVSQQPYDTASAAIGAEPREGDTLFVTTRTDDDDFTGKTFTDSTAAWAGIKEGGVSLREAIWFTETYLSDNAAVETITFDSTSLDAEDGTADKKAELTILASINMLTAANFIIDGTAGGAETITLANTGTVETLFNISKSDHTINNLSIKGFKSGATALFMFNTKPTSDATDASLIVNNSTIDVEGRIFFAKGNQATGFSNRITVNWSTLIAGTDVAFSNGAEYIFNNSYVEAETLVIGGGKGDAPYIFNNSTLVSSGEFFTNASGYTINTTNTTFVGGGAHNTTSDTAGLDITTFADGIEGTYTKEIVITNGVEFAKITDTATGDIVKLGSHYGAALAHNTPPELDPAFTDKVIYDSGDGGPDETFSIVGMFKDVDGDSTTITNVVPVAGSFPTGITYNPLTHSFIVTDDAVGGVHEFNVTAFDGLEASTEKFTITVNRASEPPTAPKQSIVGFDTSAAGSTVTDISGSLLNEAKDPDGDDSLITVLSAGGEDVIGTAGATFNLNLTSFGGRIVAVTVTVLADGSYVISDVDKLAADETATGTFQLVIKDVDGVPSLNPIDVNVALTGANDAPVITTQPSDIASVDPGKSAPLSIVSSDSDGDVLTYSLEGAPKDITISDDGKTLLIGDNTKDQTYVLKIVVTDSSGVRIVSQAFSVTVNKAPVKLVVTTGSQTNTDGSVAESTDDSAGYTYNGESADELVIAFSGNGGLSLREAIWIANTLDGKEIITIDSSLSEIVVDSTIIITSDLELQGNGVDNTTITVTSGSIEAKQTSADGITFDANGLGSGINVSISAFKITGNSSSAALIRAIGFGNSQTGGEWSEAVLVNLSVLSSEISDHTNAQSTGGAFYSEFASLKLHNLYIHDVEAKKGAAVLAILSNTDVYGVTVTNSNISDKGGLLQLDSRQGNAKHGGVKATLTVAQSFTSWVNYSTFFNNTSAKAFDMVAMQTTNNFGGHNVGYNNGLFTVSDVGTEGITNTTKEPVLAADKHNGVTYYIDDIPDAGADQAVGYTDPFVDSDSDVRDQFSYNGTGSNTYNIQDPSNPLFVDNDGDTLKIANAFLSGPASGNGITISSSGMVTVSPGTGPGTYKYLLTASDGNGGFVSTEFTIFVVDKNTPNEAPSYKGANDDDRYVHTAPDTPDIQTVPIVTWFDIHGDKFTVTGTLSDGSALPTWITVDPASGTLVIDKTVPGYPSHGDTLRIILTAKEDGSQRSRSYLFTFVLNHAPKVVSKPNTDASWDTSDPAGRPDGLLHVYTGKANNSYNMSVHFSDPDAGETLGYTVTDSAGNSVDGITIDSNGILHFDNAKLAYFDSKLVVTATDSESVAASIEFTLRVDGPVRTTVEAGTTAKTVEYFPSLADGETATYEATLLNADGSSTAQMPRGFTFDSATGELSLAYKAILGQFTFVVSRTTSNGVLTSRSVEVTSVQSTTALVIDDVYVARTRGTLEDALKRAIEEASDGQTIIFDISAAYVDALGPAYGYNKDFDGDGDTDLYIKLNGNMLINKSLSIFFDTDGVTGDRDIILYGGGFDIVGDYSVTTGTREKINVNLSQFAVLNAQTSALYQNSASLTVRDADLANGNAAYWVEFDDATKSYGNEGIFTNINIYGNNTDSSGSMEYDQGTVHVGGMAKFEMVNGFIGDNSFKYGLIRGDGNSTFKNVTIARNRHVDGIKGKFLNGGNYENVTIVDNDVRAYIDSKGEYAVTAFTVNVLFTNTIVIGNIYSQWLDDPSANTPESYKDIMYTGYNEAFSGTMAERGNFELAGDTEVNGESSDTFLTSSTGYRNFTLIDGVIHYIDGDSTTGADSYKGFTYKANGAFKQSVFNGQLSEVLEAARERGIDSFTEEQSEPTSIVAKDDPVSKTHDKYKNLNGRIDGGSMFIPLEDSSTITYVLKIYKGGEDELGGYEEVITPIAGFSFNKTTGVLTYNEHTKPGLYQFIIVATEAGEATTSASKAFTVTVLNHAPERTQIPAKTWPGFTRGDLNARPGYDLGDDTLFGEDSDYFNDLYEDGKLQFTISGVTLNGRAVSTRSFAIVDGRLIISDRLLAAGNYQVSVKAVDSDGGVSNKPLVVSLNVNDDGRVHAGDGGTITVTTGLDNDNTSAADKAFNLYNGSYDEKLQAAWIALQQGGVSLREAVWFAQKNGSGSDLVITSTSQNKIIELSHSLNINTNIRFSNISIVDGAGQIVIGQNARVTMTDVAFADFSINGPVIVNNGTLSMQYIEFVGNSSVSTLIATGNGASTILQNVTARNNNSAGTAFAGALTITNSTIIGSGNTANIDQIASVITDESMLYHDPVTGNLNIVTRPSGVNVINDNVIGAGADEGMQNLRPVSVVVKDRDGYALGFGERSQIVASTTGDVKAYYWFVDGKLDSSQNGNTYTASVADAGKIVVLKYVIADSNGFMQVSVVTVGRLSTDVVPPDAPVVNEEADDVDEMDATPELTGTAPADIRVELLITKDGVEIERTVVLSDAHGMWSFEARYLYGGTYKVSVLALNAASIESDSADNPEFEFYISPNARDENPMQGLSPVVNSSGSTAAPNVEAPEFARFDQDGDDLLAGEDVESDRDEYDEFVEDITGDEGSVHADRPTIVRSSASKLQLHSVATIIYGESNVVVSAINDSMNGQESDGSIDAHVENIFKSIDVNNDGVLDESEVPSNEMIEFRDLDIDGDGEIDADELKEFIDEYDGDKDLVLDLLEGSDHVIESAPQLSSNFTNSVQKALKSLFMM